MGEPSVLELYIMACLERGMRTPYDLLRSASLSLGATSPALKRLLDSGRISRKNDKSTTARPRHEYQVTTVGREALHSNVNELLSTSSGDQDVDSLLRIVEMAKLYGASMSEMADFLRRASKHRERLAMHAAVEAENQGWEYPKLRTRIDAVRLQAEAKELANLARRAAASQGRNAPGTSLRVAEKAHKAF